MNYTHHGRPLQLPTPPTRPREWTITVPIPDGMAPSDHAAADTLAADIAPPDYIVAGTIPISRRDSPRDEVALRDPKWWRLRITYHPASWTRPLTAPVEVYAAAQIAGLSTNADDVMRADHHGIQYRTPDGAPTWRHAYTWQDDLPPHVRAALGAMYSIGQHRRVGYMRARPDTARAALVAQAECEGDAAQYDRARLLVAGWVRDNYPAMANP